MNCGEEYKKISGYSIQEKIAEGTYGCVYKCERDDGEIKAIKKTKIKGNGIDSPLELSIMMTYDHPYICCAEKIVHDYNNLYIVMEKAEMDLSGYLKTGNEISQDWFGNLLQAVFRLHKENIIHCDIKPNNVLIRNNNAILTDFSHSILVREKNKQYTHKIGSLYYCSPESVVCDPWSYPTDIWSLGCVFYEMITKKRVVETKNKTTKEVSRIIKRGSYKKEMDNSEYKSLIIDDMLKFNQEERKTARELLNHPLFCGLEIEPLYTYTFEKTKLSKDMEKKYNNIAKTKTMDDKILKLSTVIFAETIDEKNGKLEMKHVEACISIAHKIIKGGLPLNGSTSTSDRKLAREEITVCELMDYRLHI